MKAWLISLRSIAAASAVVILGSCTEKLDSAGVCAVLCPPLGGAVQNITIDAVALDTAVRSLSGLGAEPRLLLATRGDTLDARMIIRFDSLPLTFREGTDTAKVITVVDSASLRFRLDTLSIKGTDPVTIEAYDVDTTANDTATAAVLALFRPDRFIGSQTFTRAQLRDSIEYLIPNSHVLAKVQSRARMRFGLRAVSTASSQIVFFSEEAGLPPRVRFRVSADTALQPFVIAPFSQTPSDDAVAKENLGDYTVFARRPPEGNPTDLNIGGIPPNRVYFRFDIPANILDSSTIVRATLLLHQIPNPVLDPTDTVYVIPQLVLAGIAVTDPAKAAQIVTGLGIDTLKARPGDAGPTEVEVASAFPVWRTVKADESPRAIILRARDEGTSPLQIRFYSLEAAPGLRPRLRISYTNDVPLGLP